MAGIDLGQTAYGGPLGYSRQSGYAGRYESPGGALAAGIHSGISLAEHFQDRETTAAAQAKAAGEHDEDRAFQGQERQNTLDSQSRATAAAQAKNMMDQADLDDKQTGSELTAISAKYGGNISAAPQDVQDSYFAKYQAARDQRREAVQKVSDSFLTQQQRDAAKTARDMQKGQQNTDPAAIGRMIVTTTGQPLSYFQPGHDDRGMPGQSQAQQDVDAAHAAMDSQDPEQIKDAMNKIFAHRFNVGKGQLLPNGMLRGDSKVAAILPHPDADKDEGKAGMVVPVMQTQQVDPASGQVTGQHHEPYTACKSCDPDAKVLGIPMKKAFDYVGQIAAMQTLLDGPQGQQVFDASQQEQGVHAAILQGIANQNAVKSEKKGFKTDTLNVKGSAAGSIDAQSVLTNQDTGEQKLGILVPGVQANPTEQLKSATQQAIGTQRNIAGLTENERTAQSRENAAKITAAGHVDAAAASSAGGFKAVGDKEYDERVKLEMGQYGLDENGKRIGGYSKSTKEAGAQASADAQQATQARQRAMDWRQKEDTRRAGEAKTTAPNSRVNPGARSGAGAQNATLLNQARAAVQSNPGAYDEASRIYQNRTGQPFPDPRPARSAAPGGISTGT